MANFLKKNLALGFNNPLQSMAPEPIASRRAPTTSDMGQFGQLWINTLTGDFYVLTSITAGVANWEAPSTSASTVSSLQITGGVGTVLTVDAAGAADFGGAITVAGLSTFNGNSVFNGDVSVLGDFDLNTSDAIAFVSTSDTDPAISLTTNGGTSETMIFTVTQGTATDALNLVSTVGGITAVAGLASADAINLTASAGGINITAAGGATTGDIDVSTNGSVTISSTEDAANNIRLSSNGGTSETILIESLQGTAVNSIDIISSSGGISLTSNVASNDGINLAAVNGGVDIDGARQINLLSTFADASAIVVQASAGGIDIAAGGGPTTGDIDITTNGSITLGSTENAAQAIYLHANGGNTETILIRADQGTSSSSVNLVSDAGGITMTAGLNTSSALTLGATVGGFDLDTALDIDMTTSAGSINLRANEGVADGITIVSAAGGIDITGAGGATTGDIDISTNGSVNISSSEAAADAIKLTSSAGGVAISSTNNTFSLTANTGVMTVRSTDSVAAALTLQTNAGVGVSLFNGTQRANIIVGTGSPNGSLTASQGSLFINVAGTGADSLYTNTDGGTTWVAF